MITKTPVETVMQHSPDKRIPSEHMFHSNDDNVSFDVLSKEPINFGTLITEQCTECGHVRKRVEHKLQPVYDNAIDLDERALKLVSELSEGPCWALDHVAYMSKRHGVFPTKQQAREYANELVGGVHGDFRLARVHRPEVLCLYEPRTERVVASGLLPTAEYRKDGESAYDSPSVAEAFDRYLNPPNHMIVNGAEQPPRFAPDDYPGSQLDWHLDQACTLEVRLHTPELALDN